MNRTLKVKFVMEKETRNTIRYEEVNTHFIGYLYVQKETFNGGIVPKRLTVTLDFED